MPYYPDIRARINLIGCIEEINIDAIGLEFINGVGFSIEVQLDDIAVDTKRPLYRNKMRQKGSSIRLEKNEKNVQKNYCMSFSQDIFS